eukprot:790821-Amphidinium_carterae.1
MVLCPSTFTLPSFLGAAFLQKSPATSFSDTYCGASVFKVGTLAVRCHCTSFCNANTAVRGPPLMRILLWGAANLEIGAGRRRQHPC